MKVQGAGTGSESPSFRCSDGIHGPTLLTTRRSSSRTSGDAHSKRIVDASVQLTHTPPHYAHRSPLATKNRKPSVHESDRGSRRYTGTMGFPIQCPRRSALFVVPSRDDKRSRCRLPPR